MTDAASGAEIVAPHPAALLESLRAFGYTTQAAISDLVDNSISADARNVWIHFEWAGEDSFVTVRDDGAGMNDVQLPAAMRAGSRSPLEHRDASDLGRFGLGLKTASFSQCRRLTVRSRARSDQATHTRRWDLDYVRATSEWWLLEGAAPGSEARLAGLRELDAGTVVLWEVMDRLVHGADVDDQRAQGRFLEIVDEVDRHVAMVFHRFIDRGLALWVNDRRVTAWDPYLSHETATQRLPEERLRLHGEAVVVRPWVLPHRSKLDLSAHQRGAGAQGWNAQQGFYVYRGNRLLVPGSWLGLGFKQEEHYKLARIAVDLPNSLDSEWDIDVRKSRARPPGVLRDDLKRIARMTRERAVEVYRHRGKIMARATSQPHVFVWERVAREGQVLYRINRQHPLVLAVLAERQGDAAAIRALLRLVEETVPVPTIVIDTAEQPESTPVPFAGVPSAEIMSVLHQIFRSLRSLNLTPTQVRERILTMEPFQGMVELVAALDDVDAHEEIP